MTLKFSSDRGHIVSINPNTITFNKPSPIHIRVQYSPIDTATLGSFLSASFSSTVRSSAPTVHTGTTISYAGITSRRTQDVPSWTRYTAPVIPNTVHYAQDNSADNMSRTKTAEATTTTTHSSVPSTVEGNLTPIVPNTVDFPPLSSAHVTTTTTPSSAPTPPPILTGQIGHNPLQLQIISPVSQSLYQSTAQVNQCIPSSSAPGQQPRNKRLW